jgi:outer membrane protein assembly factor BamB
MMETVSNHHRGWRPRPALATAAVVVLGSTLGVVGAGVLPTGHVGAAISCTASDPTGGSWPSYGHDLSNTRTQDQECVIGRSNVRSLKAKWVFSTASAGGGSIESTAAVADGMVFVGSGSGRVFALRAATGQVAWSVQLAPPTTPAGFGGLVVGAPAIDSAAGLVVVAVDQMGGPFLVALKEATGAVAWRSAPIDSSSYGPWGAVAAENASPSLWNGLVFLGFYGSEYDPRARGGVAVLDELTGAILAHSYTISDADYALGYRGASIWATAVIDPATAYAYVGTGNPGGHPTDPSQFPAQCAGTLPGHRCQAAIEDPKSDAIIKIDLDRSRATFGQIVGVYKGKPDSYVQGVGHQPVCANAGNVDYGVGGGLKGAWSGPCGQLDLDFGASPNLFGLTGARMVGELQKAGVYHAVATDTMRGVWRTVVGAPCAVCNAGSTAVDTSAIYGASAPGALAFSLALNGAPRWATPIGDGVHYESSSVANGVAYTVDNAGFLDAFNTTTGVLLSRHPLALDVHTLVTDLSSAGVAIAGHRIYVALSGFLVAYGL